MHGGLKKYTFPYVFEATALLLACRRNSHMLIYHAAVILSAVCHFLHCSSPYTPQEAMVFVMVPIHKYGLHLLAAGL